MPPGGFLEAANWTPTFYADRGRNLRDLRQALETDPNYAVLIDAERVALVGHSLGEYSILSLAGAWSTWKMGKVTAVVALASYAEPLLRNAALANVSLPVLVQGRTADILAPAADQESVYASIAGHGCKIIYQGASHFAWTALDHTGQFHRSTADATVSFLMIAFAGRIPTATALPSSATATPDCK